MATRQIYAVSYGWGTAGRFHHARSHLRRFLSALGGYTGSRDTYSNAAGAVLVKNVVGTSQAMNGPGTSWKSIVLGREDGVAKSAECAAELSEISADIIRGLARQMAAARTFIIANWSLQRGDHGEQPVWAAIALAAALGQIARREEDLASVTAAWKVSRDWSRTTQQSVHR